MIKQDEDLTSKLVDFMVFGMSAEKDGIQAILNSKIEKEHVKNLKEFQKRNKDSKGKFRLYET
jgi:hypothetical protein